MFTAACLKAVGRRSTYGARMNGQASLVAEARVEKIDDFFAMEAKLATNETLRKTMADYHDLVDRGRREIYRLES